MKILVFFVVGYVLHIFCEKSLLDRPIGGFLRKRRIELGGKNIPSERSNLDHWKLSKSFLLSRHDFRDV